MNPEHAKIPHRPGSRVACFLVGVLVFCAGVPAPAVPCGMSTHGEICTRAARYFASEAYPDYETVLRDYPEAYQAGAAFPDWGYSFGYPAESEEAHWPPFLEAMALYLREQCPRPWGEEDRRRIAFFLGVVSHSVADIDWHGLDGVREGFIDVMSRQEFHGDWGAAHEVADSGGDFVLSYEGDMSWLAPQWYFPLRDLAEIYQGLGYEEVTEEVLLPRVFVLFVGAVANRFGGRLLYGQTAGASPFLAERFTDYAPGGLDSMALRTVRWWGDYIGLMEQGLFSDLAQDPSGSFAGRGPEQTGVLAAVSGEDLLPDVGSYGVRAEVTERGVFLLAEDPDPRAGREEGLAEHLLRGPFQGPDTRVISHRPYGYLGASLVTGDLDADGLADVVVGAPGAGDPGDAQRGSVYVVTGRTVRDRALLHAAEADQVLQGPEPRGRFGWALALVDLNADRILDLAVSSPLAGATELDLRGRVQVYFGTGGPALLFSSSPDVVLLGEEPYTRLGWSLGSGDVNGDGFDDLLVGAPHARGGGEQRGLARVYLSDVSLRTGTTWGPSDAGWFLNGLEDYDWFGARLAVARGGASGEPVLLVGAPGAVAGSVQATGRLYGYVVHGPTPHDPVFTLTGESEFDQVGQAFAVADFSGDGGETLALAAPTRNVGPLRQAGQVYLLDTEVLRGDLWLGELPEARVLAGDREFGRMGWGVAAGHANRDGTADLLVTQPWLGDPIHPVRGGASLWLGGERRPGGTCFAFQADTRIQGSRDRARLGDAAGMADVNGDGLDDWVLASSRDSEYASYGGTVSIFLTPACHDRDADGYGDPASVSCRFTGADCNDDPSKDPEPCSACACGTRPCAGCARCMHPGAREFALDGYDSNCNGETDCFIAQAAFGSELAGKIHVLRGFRDRVARSGGGAGLVLVDAYYRYGPWLASRVRGPGVLRGVVRVLLLPLVGFAWWVG